MDSIVASSARPQSPTAEDLVRRSIEELDQARALLAELLELLGLGGAVDPARRLGEHARTLMRQADQGTGDGLRLYGAPHRWTPRP